MKGYWKFLTDNYKILLFGGLLTMFSSLGQTFLISLYVPSILNYFTLSKANFGLAYAIATLAASAVLVGLGPLIDYRPLWPLIAFTLILLSLASVVLGTACHPVMLITGLFGLRLAGQALMPHISMTVMSRYFDRDRGKALSTASLGFPIGEMVFPLIIGLLISLAGWRQGFILSGILAVFLLFLLFSQLEIKKYDIADTQRKRASRSSMSFIKNTATEGKFWIVTLPTFVMSFIVTGFFFFQYLLAEERGWSVEWLAISFTGYAVSRLLFAIVGGPLTDKFTAGALFPYYLVPMGVGLLILSYSEIQWVAPVFFILVGVTSGAQGIINTAVLAEVYGVDRLGSVRSLFSTVMVISTATSPWLFGLLLDNHIRFEAIALMCLSMIALCTLNSLRIKKYLHLNH